VWSKSLISRSKGQLAGITLHNNWITLGLSTSISSNHWQTSPHKLINFTRIITPFLFFVSVKNFRDKLEKSQWLSHIK